MTTSEPPVVVKIVVSGGFGVGKTTFVEAVSEIEPLVTEAEITEVSIGVDDTRKVGGKTTTTVALDFGRITIDDSLLLYLFGTPGQERFTFLWDDLVDGALGAIVLLDTRRIEDGYPVLDYFEERTTPLLIAMNQFDDAPRFAVSEVREALDLDPDIPILECDARDRQSVKEVLVRFVERVLTLRMSGRLL